MNPELQKQLADLLKSLLATASDAKSFAAEQIPPLVQEKILYGRLSSSVWLVLGCLGCVYLMKATKRLYAVDDMHPGTIFTGLGALGSAVIALIAGDQALLVWVAPRLYIVDWLKEFVAR